MQKRLGQLTKEGKVGSHSTGTQASSDLRWRTESCLRTRKAKSFGVKKPKAT